MPRAEFARHPWEVARFKFFERMLKTAQLARRPLAILDVGAGDTWFSRQLESSLPAGSRVVCWDTGYEGSARLNSPGNRVSVTKEQPSEQFDLILMLDVAEHVSDDQAFVSNIVRVNTRPNAYLLFSVPAWPELMSSHDVALGHYRRYRPAQAERLLESAGLRILVSGGLFPSLLIPRAAQVIFERVLGVRTAQAPATLEWRNGERIRRYVQAALELDTRLSSFLAQRRKRLPGLSFWALCQTS